ncbi:NADPH-dependent diflavin oxidoreductase 1 [Drosophila tropicalis]|uniref:NADPH-dependent diflavin oxidoreductase 1 n=1 Tax=Drosophila tropicalis TaxID=46794 RepID=UPI0035ABDE7A
MRLLILYASQTGTAQDVAEQIWRESRQWGFTGPVLSIHDYDIQQLVGESLVVFVVATTGDGVEPDTMKQAWRFLLKRSLPNTSLMHMQYACLGLGDSSYTKFNFAAKKLDKRLQNLGAVPICPLGLCDDQHDYGYLGASLLWIEGLWMSLKSSLGLGKRNQSLAVNKYLLERDSSPQVQLQDKENKLVWNQRHVPYNFILKENSRTTPENHFQDVRLLRLVNDFPDQVLTWQPGDIVELQPHNSRENVEKFFEILSEHNLEFGPDTVVRVTQSHSDLVLPQAYASSISLRNAAKYVWDLCARPRQRFFEVLSQNCTDEMEQTKLLEFSTAVGLEDLISYVNRPRRWILEVLQDFPNATARLTLEQLFEMMPLMQTRSFSIASDSSTRFLDLLVAVVQYKTILQSPRLGLCSNWMKNLPSGTIIKGALKPATMTWPKDLTTPLILVATGTGIAPFRCLLQQRVHAKIDEGCEIGPLVVFFGCRNKSSDFHFEVDFNKWLKCGLIEGHFAFSRDGADKVYVQHLIKKQKEHITDLIKNQNASVYVVGSSNSMPKSVKEAFIESLDGDSGYLDEMIKRRRYQEETWS